MSIWAGMYPAFTFTVIYPVEVWRRSGKVEVWRRSGKNRRLVAIWCYVRVTQGPCSTGHNEPIYATTTNSNIQQPMVQQVVIQQPQPMMVQTANGQYVQGQPAMMNGQQVVVVHQPNAQPPQGYGMQQQQPQQMGYGYPGTTR
eukprot:CAMPEP_0201596722 /NCGR_PEP_ID=MMETSP0190_2-20130828/193352_1 /ASSEMBLY_ACC=CAM_ASM_000263 /TAXON_ID=37353 /ORGANISM="Rosalina sp." /LENGTH=142 /DNA_ID=CAMNT_0048057247 /DNA_START=444 /DNA_END=872 /DNA_ORIENTATION=+